MSVSLLFAYIVAVVVLIATPGPIVALVINAATRHGFKYALITVLGANLASMVLLASAGLIIAGVIALDEQTLKWVSLIGCSFIAWMALNGLRAGLTSQEEVGSEQETPVRQHSGFFNGFFLGISNPKDIIFFVAFFPQFISVTPNLKLSLAVLTLVWMLADFVILLSYALMMRGNFFQQHQGKIALLSSAFLLLIAISGALYILIGG
ncbi:LysE family translocator [Pseudomonas sp. C27(2019)]|uniref:LysE family translocator n=1 Tax=Pseudomonas sp. C27(2019) TaxID=2604941 RepID=UPI001247C7F7|nr:LysE family translocator [Pseudomonas sp. C27(2019)]QEY57934.1 LysE family translocator [Pseudomonas sp. C27(2019)]